MSSKSLFWFFYRREQPHIWQVALLFVSLSSLLLPAHPLSAAPRATVARTSSGLATTDVNPPADNVVARPRGLQGATELFAPQIGMDSNGNRAVIVWTDLSAANQANVYAQVFDTQLLTVTNLITVATGLPFTTSQIVRVDAAIDDIGRFAVVYDNLAGLSGLPDIGLQRYNADGTPYETLFSIGTTNRLDINPAIDLAANGRITVGYDQVATTATPNTHRFNIILFASFENLASNTTTSISSTGGLIFPALAFNNAEQYLVTGCTLPSNTNCPVRVFSSTGSVSASTVVTSTVKNPLGIENVPGSSKWQTIYVKQDSSQNQIVTRLASVGANTSVAPVISSMVVLAQDSPLSEKVDLTVDSEGSFAIAYRRLNAASENELVTSSYNISGTLLNARIQATGAGTSPSYAIVRGATASKSLLGLVTQTEFTETSGGLVDFELRVNRAFGPFAEDDSFDTLEDTPLSATVAGNDSDSNEFHPLLYAKASDVDHGGLTFNPDGSFVYTPSLNYVGADGFLYTVTNNQSITDTGTVTLSVINVSDAPIAVNDPATTPEEQSITIAALANDSDGDSGDSLSLAALGTPAHGSVAISGTTELIYTPTLNFVGVDSFTYTTTDGVLTATAIVTVTVTNVNDAPVAADDSYRAITDRILTVNAPGVQSNDSDVEADPLAAGLVAGPGNGTLILNQDGSFTYTPNPGYSGTDSFTYKVNDGAVDSNVATVSFIVNAPDTAHTTLQTTPNPTIVGQSVTLTATVSGLVRQLVMPTGTITFEADGIVLGSVALNAGMATWTKSDWDVGTHLVTAHYQGDYLYAASVSAPIQQRVEPLPVAVNDAVGIIRGKGVNIPVLANDTDLAGGGLTVLNITQPAHGVAIIAADSQTVIYTSTQDFQGTDSFAYTVQDSNGRTDSALVAVLVRAENITTVEPQIGLVDVDTETQLSFPNSTMRIEIALPAGVYTAPLGVKDLFYLAYTVHVTATEHTQLAPAGFRFGNVLFDLSAYLNDTAFDHFQFAKPVTLTLTYDPALIDTTELQTLTLLYWNDDAWVDDGITLLAHDIPNHRLAVLITHLSEFALFAKAPTALDLSREPSQPVHLYLPLIIQE